VRGGYQSHFVTLTCVDRDSYEIGHIFLMKPDNETGRFFFNETGQGLSDLVRHKMTLIPPLTQIYLVNGIRHMTCLSERHV